MLEEYIKDMEEVMGAIGDAYKKFDSNGNKYKMERITKELTHLFDRFCPFKVDDRVELASTPKIDKNTRWGWFGAKHHLIEGAPGKVVSRDYYEGEFRFSVEMDLESWVSGWGEDKGMWKSVSNRHTYCFYDTQLRASTKEEWIIHRTEGMAPMWVSELIGDLV